MQLCCWEKKKKIPELSVGRGGLLGEAIAGFQNYLSPEGEKQYPEQIFQKKTISGILSFLV